MSSSSSFPPPELREIATEVASLLKARKETISVAETVRSTSQPPHHQTHPTIPSSPLESIPPPLPSLLHRPPTNPPQGSRRPDIRRPPRPPRRLHLLRRRPDAVHAGLARRLRGLERSRHGVVPRADAGRGRAAGAQYARETGECVDGG